MPSLILRGLSDDLMARLSRYAESQGMGRPSAAASLLAIALDHLDARSAGAAETNRVSAMERRARARHAAQARWRDAPRRRDE